MAAYKTMTALHGTLGPEVAATCEQHDMPGNVPVVDDGDIARHGPCRTVARQAMLCSSLTAGNPPFISNSEI